jgi:hypothetical protein
VAKSPTSVLDHMRQRGIGVDAVPEYIMLVPIGRLLPVVGLFRK